MNTTCPTPLSSILDRRLAAYSAVAAAALTAPALPSAEAVIVYSGPVNINVAVDSDGLYLNVVTGAFATGAPVAGWDLNPYSSSTTTPNFTLWGPTTQTWFSPAGVIEGPYNLASGTSIGGAATNFFRPGGSIDVLMNLNSANNYLGFRFLHEGTGQIHHGWVQLQFGSTIGDRRIIGYAYESTPGASIAAAAVPEPSTTALLGVMAAGAFGLRQWRRRKAAK